jgi:hypothetical protein
MLALDLEHLVAQVEIGPVEPRDAAISRSIPASLSCTTITALGMSAFRRHGRNENAIDDDIDLRRIAVVACSRALIFPGR